VIDSKMFLIKCSYDDKSNCMIMNQIVCKKNTCAWIVIYVRKVLMYNNR
jgi:hypothetical protein